MMTKILLTGFEPFGGEYINPSWELVKPYHQQRKNEAKVISAQLPCVFGHSLTALKQLLEQHQPDIVICFGQAGGRADITVERIGINIDDARIPDNLDQQPIDETIVINGPAAYFSTLPIKTIVHDLRQQHIPASVSQTAGTFVCNHVMYGLLHHIAKHKLSIKAGFIHIPYLPEQAINHLGAASMSMMTLSQAVEQIILTVITTTEDKKIIGGALQ